MADMDDHDLERHYRELGWKPPGERDAIPPPAGGSAAEDKARKPRWDLVDFGALEWAPRVMAWGETKHRDNNGWQKKTQDDHFGSLMRHIAAHRKGELLDPESGMPHLSHALCRILFLLSCSDLTKKEQ